MGEYNGGSQERLVPEKESSHTDRAAEGGTTHGVPATGAKLAAAVAEKAPCEAQARARNPSVAARAARVVLVSGLRSGVATVSPQPAPGVCGQGRGKDEEHHEKEGVAKRAHGEGGGRHG
jgi:hypothetical protein